MPLLGNVAPEINTPLLEEIGTRVIGCVGRISNRDGHPAQWKASTDTKNFDPSFDGSFPIFVHPFQAYQVVCRDQTEDDVGNVFIQTLQWVAAS